MAFRIRHDATPPAPPRIKAKKDRDYLSFVHQLPCVITGKMPVEAAHLSFSAPLYGHWGRGKGLKVSDRWCLPLHASMHREGKDSQHSSNERVWWESHRIDPHALALTLYGLWQELGDEAVEPATRVSREHRAKSHNSH